MPASLPEPEYLDDDLVGHIRKNGCVHCRPNGSPIDLQLSIAFAGQLAAVRPSAEDGVYHVWFSRYRIAEVDFRTNPDRPRVSHLFAHLQPLCAVCTQALPPRAEEKRLVFRASWGRGASQRKLSPRSFKRPTSMVSRSDLNRPGLAGGFLS
jgi:hypothetical protein